MTSVVHVRDNYVATGNVVFNLVSGDFPQKVNSKSVNRCPNEEVPTGISPVFSEPLVEGARVKLSISDCIESHGS